MPVSIKACGKRALSYDNPSSNHTQSGVSTAARTAINLSATSRRTSCARTSSDLTARQELSPRSVNAQARGELKVSAVDNASANRAEAHKRRDGLVSLRAHSPSAHSVRPWLSSEPLSSSQVRLKPMKLRNRLVSRFQACWTNAANRAVKTSERRASPGLFSAQANKSARALSSTQ